MRAVVLLAAVTILTNFGPANAEAGTARAASHSNTLIVPGRSIGPVSLGMSQASVERAYPFPFTVTTEGNLRFEHGNLSVLFHRVDNVLSAVEIATFDPGFGTEKGIAFGSSLQAVKDAYPGRCNVDPLAPHDTFDCGYEATPAHFINFHFTPSVYGPQTVDGINVTGTGTDTAPPGGTSCPLPGSAAARISQTGKSCDVRPPCGRTGTVADECLYDADQKKLFRKLAKIAHDGYVVDKAIDDVISIPEDVITKKITGKGLVTEFVVSKFWGKYVENKILPKIPSFGKLPSFKRVPYNEILDAAKYASWLDYSKYWVLSRLADDPPDPSFTSLAKPPALRGIPDAVPALGDSKAREVALYVALLTTVERAAGARAAGDTNAAAVQLRHASALSNRLVTLLGAQQRALKKAAKVVGKMPALRLPRGLVKRAARRLDAPASATFERKALAKLGFTAARIRSVADAAPDININDLTKPFKKVLGLEAEAKLIARERAALAAFANKYAKGGP